MDVVIFIHYVFLVRFKCLTTQIGIVLHLFGETSVGTHLMSNLAGLKLFGRRPSALACSA
jgi:hypothetical protein